MPERNVSYAFGRLNLIATYADKKHYVTSSLAFAKSVTHGNFEWGFFGVEQLSIEGEDLLHGYLVKSEPCSDEEVVDKEEHRVALERLENKVVAKSPFLLHPKSGVIAFHPVSGKVSTNQFRRRFEQVFEEANENLLCDADVQIIPDENILLECMSRFRHIKWIRICLHPTNPRSRPVYRSIDDDMKNLRVDEYQQEFISRSKQGIKPPEEGDAPYNAIIMANDGYGKAKIRGTDDKGEPLTVSTESTPLKADVPSNAERVVAAGILLLAFKQIWDRFRE